MCHLDGYKLQVAGSADCTTWSRAEGVGIRVRVGDGDGHVRVECPQLRRRSLNRPGPAGYSKDTMCEIGELISLISRGVLLWMN